MHEVKSPKKPLIYYYVILALVLLCFNFLMVPFLAQKKVIEVDYGTFMSMTESGDIGQVQIQDNQIVFTDKKEENIYKL